MVISLFNGRESLEVVKAPDYRVLPQDPCYKCYLREVCDAGECGRR